MGDQQSGDSDIQARLRRGLWIVFCGSLFRATLPNLLGFLTPIMRGYFQTCLNCPYPEWLRWIYPFFGLVLCVGAVVVLSADKSQLPRKSLGVAFLVLTLFEAVAHVLRVLSISHTPPAIGIVLDILPMVLGALYLRALSKNFGLARLAQLWTWLACVYPVAYGALLLSLRWLMPEDPLKQAYAEVGFHVVLLGPILIWGLCLIRKLQRQLPGTSGPLGASATT